MGLEINKNSYEPKQDRIEIYTDLLTGAICDSADYIFYENCLCDLKNCEDLYEKLMEYQRKNLVLRLRCEEEEISIKQQAKLYEEYRDILTRPPVVDFLTAQQRMCLLLQKVYDRIARDVKIDVSYLNEDERR